MNDNLLQSWRLLAYAILQANCKKIVLLSLLIVNLSLLSNDDINKVLPICI